MVACQGNLACKRLAVQKRSKRRAVQICKASHAVQVRQGVRDPQVGEKCPRLQPMNMRRAVFKTRPADPVPSPVALQIINCDHAAAALSSPSSATI